MTTVGHSLTGMAIAVALAPRGLGALGWAAFLAVGLLAGNVPDVAVPGWGHEHIIISHSVFVYAAFMLLIAPALLLWPRGTLGFRARLATIIAAAWLSHLLLDCCYKHGQGLPMFWPFTHGQLALPLPWFSDLPYGHWQWDPRTLRVALKDLIIIGPLLLLSVCCRLIGWWRDGEARAGQEPEAPKAL
jgi:membrane-bound metal-dependent hydrolase YbcI (DUF457 family)